MNKHSHNLMVTVHAFVCKYQEDSDLLFTLYDADEARALTENYVVKWGRQGLARDLDQFDNHRVLFTVSSLCSTFVMMRTQYIIYVISFYSIGFEQP